MEDGRDEQLGIMNTSDAQKLAYEKNLDLVLIAPQATPPVCRIMDYGKFRYERDKKEKEAKKKQTTVEVKEVQLSCRIDTHDFNTKANNAIRFLSAGNKVRVILRFRGREMTHQDIGREILAKFEEACSEVATVDKKPTIDGRMMSMFMSPIKVAPAKAEAAKETKETAAEEKPAE
jgi:translation initiation factor IF-3